MDTGIGMTVEEIKKYINQIAFSGAEDFINKYKDIQNNMIGHFGLGFYSAFMVADKVTIDSLSVRKEVNPLSGNVTAVRNTLWVKESAKKLELP